MTKTCHHTQICWLFKGSLFLAFSCGCVIHYASIQLQLFYKTIEMFHLSALI